MWSQYQNQKKTHLTLQTIAPLLSPAVFARLWNVWSVAQSVDGIDGVQQFCRNRMGVNKVEAPIDDIMNIFKVIDESCCRDNLPTFCAVKKDRVPILTDDLSDIAAIPLELINSVTTAVELTD